MKLLKLSLVTASCMLFTACLGSGSGNSMGSATGTPQGDLPAPESSTFVSYFKIDPISDCEDRIVKTLDLRSDAGQALMSNSPCASSDTAVSAVPVDAITYHQRFNRFLVYAGDIFILEEKYDRQGGRTPAAYCKKRDDETDVGFLYMALQLSDGDEQCSVTYEFKSADSGYYNGGSGGAPCTTYSFVRSESALQFKSKPDARVVYEVIIDLTSGDRMNGYAGQALIGEAGQAASQADLVCFVNSGG